MTPEKVIEAFGQLEAGLRAVGGASERDGQITRLSAEERAKPIGDLPRSRQIDHLTWLACEGANYARRPEKIEKAMRWLGFVQGGCWLLGIFSIADAKDMNRPTNEAFRADH